MAYIRKTRDEFEVQGYYAHGWECLTCEESMRAAIEQKRCYRENEGGSYRIVARRVPIEGNSHV